MAVLLLPALIFMSVALGAWSLLSLAFGGSTGEKRKLRSRLSNQNAKQVNRSSKEQKSIRNDLRDGGLDGLLLRFGPFRSIDAMLKLSMPEVEFKKFVLMQIGIAFGIGMIVLAVTLHPIVAITAAVLGGVAPMLYLVRRKIGRQRMLDDQLPDAMDFLGRALKAGHSLSSGLQMMGNELPSPINAEFGHAFAQHSLGVPMEEVLKSMTKRIDSTDFAFFITAVLIQRQTGGDLSEVLKNISGMIRQRVRLQQQVKAKTAEGRFTGYLLTAFPAVMFVIMYMVKPDYAQKLTGDPMGQKMLAFAFIMQVMGLFAIKKITQVRV